MIATRRDRLRVRLRRHGRLSPGCRACRSPSCRGLHFGCFELFAHGAIQQHQRPEGPEGRHPDARARAAHLYLAIMAAHVGLDPHEDIDWVVPPQGNAMELFAEGKVDAFLGFPPEPQELRARNIGRVILSTTMDQPWSDYFCCTVFGNSDFVSDAPDRDQTFPARPPQGHRPLRHRARARRARPGRWRVRAALRLRAPDPHATRHTTAGASTTRRTRCGSSRCGCTRSA